MYSKTPLNLLVPCNNGFKTIDDTNVLTRHSSNYHMCDDEIQWWSLCHEFKRYSKIILICGDRVLISPSRTHINSNKFILWSNSIPLKPIDIFIHGLFSFDTKIDIIKPHQFIIRTHLDYLLNIRVPSGINLPIFHDTNYTSFNINNPEGKKRKYIINIPSPDTLLFIRNNTDTTEK